MIKNNDGFDIQGPKPADVKMFVGDCQYSDYARKEDIPEELRFKGMVVYEMLADVYKKWRLETGTEDVDFIELPVGMKTVDELDDLRFISSDFGQAFVKNVDRGGLFIYITDNEGIINNGTIINGWTRQYDGAVNLNWFGDVSLESTWVAASSVSDAVYVPCGDYVLETNLVDLATKFFHSFGVVSITGHSTINVINIHNLTPKADPTFTGVLVTPATVMMSSLPTTDPSNVGQLYIDSGVIKVSL